MTFPAEYRKFIPGQEVLAHCPIKACVLTRNVSCKVGIFGLTLQLERLLFGLVRLTFRPNIQVGGRINPGPFSMGERPIGSLISTAWPVPPPRPLTCRFCLLLDAVFVHGLVAPVCAARGPGLGNKTPAANGVRPGPRTSPSQRKDARVAETMVSQGHCSKLVS